MYLWNTKKLIEDLKNNQVTETQFKNYYLVSSIIFLLSIVLISISPARDLKFSLAEFVIQLGLLVSWTNAIFKVNGGENGRYFLSRFVAVYTPIVIKLYVVIFIIGVLGGILLSILGYSSDDGFIFQFKPFKEMIINIVFSFVAFWRIYVAMKAINS